MWPLLLRTCSLCSSGRGKVRRAVPLQKSIALAGRSLGCAQAVTATKVATAGPVTGPMAAVYRQIAIDAKESEGDGPQARNVIWKLHQGNLRFMEKSASLKSGGDGSGREVPSIERFQEEALREPHVQAIVVGDPWFTLPVSTIFDAHPGELQNLLSCGTVISQEDALVGSVEFLYSEVHAPVILVMSKSPNDVVNSAVRIAMMHAGRIDFPPDTCVSAADIPLVSKVLPAAKDAVMEEPNASFDRLCTVAAELNMWKSIEALLSSSKVIADHVADGTLEVQGAQFDAQSGRVEFFGPHPAQAELLRHPPSGEVIRTAADPPVAADEAFATLYMSNMRYSAGHGGHTQVSDDDLRYRLSESGQNPIAVIIGCADSRAPVEILFDMRPGDLFVLRNAGNTCNAEQSFGIIGSAEYAISNLNSKCVVFCGHTKCGAVTAAVDLARQNIPAPIHTHIGKVLGEIQSAAMQAVAEMPDATITEQVKVATRQNVFDSMKKFIMGSEVVQNGIMEMDLQVHGAIYDLYSGKVEWLGQHPDLEEIVGCEIPFHRWKVSPYISSSTPSSEIASVDGTLTLLREGNERFLKGGGKWGQNKLPGSAEVPDRPKAMLLRSGETRIPLEHIFDADQGDLLVQRVLGGLENSHQMVDAPTASIEYAVVRYQPKLLVVLGETSSAIIDMALDQIKGKEAPSIAQERVLVDVSVSAVRAYQQVQSETFLTAAGKDRKVKQLATELNVLYSIEQLLYSRIIRGAVQNDGLELHAALLDTQTGEVRFLGQHPQIGEILAQYERQETTWRNSWSDPIDM